MDRPKPPPPPPTLVDWPTELAKFLQAMTKLTIAATKRLEKDE